MTSLMFVVRLGWMDGWIGGWVVEDGGGCFSVVQSGWEKLIWLMTVAVR